MDINMQAKSYAIALTSIATSMSIIFVTLGNFIRMLDFSFYFLASVALLLPITLGYHVMGFLAYLVTAILGLLFGGLTNPYYIFFCSFFGLQPLIASLLQKLKWHKIICYSIETIYFIGAVFLTYFVGYKILANSAITWINNLGNWIYLILIVIAIPMYIVYSFFMRRIANRLRIILIQINKKNMPKNDTKIEQEKIDKIDPFDDN